MSKGTSCGNGATRVSASPPSRASSAAADVATRRPSRQPRCWSSRRWGTADLTDVVEHDEGGRSRRDTPAPGLHGTLCPPTTVSSPSPEVSPETPTVPSRVPAGSWTSTPPGTGRARDSGPGASAPWAPPDAITDLSVEPVLRSGCHPVPTGVGGDDAHRRGASPRAPRRCWAHGGPGGLRVDVGGGLLVVRGVVWDRLSEPVSVPRRRGRPPGPACRLRRPGPWPAAASASVPARCSRSVPAVR
jgi:hypothetical protein